MNIRYAKKFSKDIEAISHDVKIRKRLLDLIEQIKRVDVLSEIAGIKKLKDIRVISGFVLVIIGLE